MHTADRPSFLEPEVVEQLVSRGARIGRIEIVAENVFDTSDPDEDKRVYALANRIHIKTHDSVLENILLFETGDLYDPESCCSSPSGCSEAAAGSPMHSSCRAHTTRSPTRSTCS